MRSSRSKAPMSGLAARVLIPVAIGCVALLVLAVWLLPGLAERSAIQQAEASATALAQRLQVLRTWQASEGLVKPLDGSRPAADRVNRPQDVVEAHAVPLRALLDEAGTATVQIYSAYPYPWRARRELDPFAVNALQHLSENPDGSLNSLRTDNGQTFVRAAVADKMSAEACATCHNAHPDSPVKSWRPDDVRGVLEVSVPVDAALARARGNANAALIALGFSLLALLALVAGALSQFVSQPFSVAERALKQIADGDISAPPRGLTRLAGERSEAGQLARRAGAVIARMREQRDELERRRRDELEKAAWVDSDTGQSNQGQFERQLGQAIALARRHERTLALVLIHVDGIDRTQVTFGRAMADIQRQELGARIGEALRESDDLAQLTLVDGEETFVEPPEGGDDFVVLLREAGGPDDVTAVVGRMLAALGAPVNHEGHSFGGVISIGIAMCPAHGTDTTTIVRAADAALRDARQAGGRCYRPTLANLTSAHVAALPDAAPEPEPAGTDTTEPSPGTKPAPGKRRSAPRGKRRKRRRR